ncbi:hypothetical protein STEG23_026454, partial [Scotinomys teguina]
VQSGRNPRCAEMDDRELDPDVSLQDLTGWPGKDGDRRRSWVSVDPEGAIQWSDVPINSEARRHPSEEPGFLCVSLEPVLELTL